MRIRRTALWIGLCMLPWLAACGAGSKRGSDDVVARTLVARDTVISTASELIGGAIDMVVGPDGRLYIADFQNNSILSVRPDGTDPRTIGREGSGPGEFRRPWSLGASADGIWVYDMGNARVQALDAAGSYVRQYAAKIPPLGGGRALNARGEMAAGTGGRDSALVVVLGGADSAPLTLGEPVAPPATFFDFGSIRERILRGEIPEEYRNDVVTVWDEAGSIFVAFHTEPEVRRYGPAGELLWTRTLTDPVFTTARAAFVRKNRENPDPSRLFGLRYFVDGQVVDGELWLLLNSEDTEAGVILVLAGDDGSLRRRLTLSGLSSVGYFAVDPARGRIYVTIPDEAMVVAYALEGEALEGDAAGAVSR